MQAVVQANLNETLTLTRFIQFAWNTIVSIAFILIMNTISNPYYFLVYSQHGDPWRAHGHSHQTNTATNMRHHMIRNVL
jgi:hypothetical protein